MELLANFAGEGIMDIALIGVSVGHDVANLGGDGTCLAVQALIQVPGDFANHSVEDPSLDVAVFGQGRGEDRTKLRLFGARVDVRLSRTGMV